MLKMIMLLRKRKRKRKRKRCGFFISNSFRIHFNLNSQKNYKRKLNFVCSQTEFSTNLYHVNHVKSKQI